MPKLKNSAQAVQQALDAAGVDCQVVELPSSTRTAKEAAASIGCTVAQIAKSLVFRARSSGKPVLVIASGVNRVKESAVGAILGEGIERATPAFVREATGFAIGGVPPCGHRQPIDTFLDQDLLDLPEIWAAAGTPNAVFRLEPEQLQRLTAGRVIDITRQPPQDVPKR